MANDESPTSTLFFLWGSFALSSFLSVWLVFRTLSPEALRPGAWEPPADVPGLGEALARPETMLFVALGLVLALASHFVPKRLLLRLRGRRLDADTAQALTLPMLLRYALSEGVTAVGFALGLRLGEPWIATAFAATGFLLVLLRRPSVEYLESCLGGARA